jgi:hypothetical protein
MKAAASFASASSSRTVSRADDSSSLSNSTSEFAAPSWMTLTMPFAFQMHILRSSVARSAVSGSSSGSGLV